MPSQIFKQTDTAPLANLIMTRSDHISLLEALNQDDDKQFRYILETEGVPRGTNWLDYDLLTKAVRQKSKRIVAYLLQNRCQVLKNDDTSKLDKVVKKFGWDTITERLLTLNEPKIADIHDKGDTILHLAFVNSFPEFIIDLLLRHYLHETTVNVKNREGLSFLHIACTRSNPDLAKELLQNNESDVHCQVSLMSDSIYSGYTTLHFAVEHGRLEVAKYILQLGVDIYTANRHHSTPLHLALERGEKEIIDILCYHDNRNENYVNIFGLSHFMAACASSESLVAEQYLYIAEQDPISSAKCLIDGRVKNINGYTYACYTPLHFAAEFGCLETVELLLAQGANCCTTTSQNLTPIDLACTKGHMKVCAALLQHSCGCKSEKVEKINGDKKTFIEEDQVVTVNQSVKQESQVVGNNVTDKKTVDSPLAYSSIYLHAVFLVLIAIIAFFMIKY